MDKTMYRICFHSSMQFLALTVTLILLYISPTNGQAALTIDPCNSDEMYEAEVQSWIKETIPYTFKDGLFSNISSVVQQSIYTIESQTCLRFVPRTNQQDYIEIQQNTKCCSHKGRVGYGLHPVYLNTESCGVNEQLTSLIAAAAGSLDWEFQTTHECGCGGSVYVGHPSEGIIKSPGYPSDYTSSTQCVWKFWIPTATILELEIANFELEDEIRCTYDYLEFTKQSEDGNIESMPFRHCGNVKNTNLNFTAGSLSLRFVTDMDIQATGFEIKYRTFTIVNGLTSCSEYNGGCLHQCVPDKDGVKQYCSCNPGYALISDKKTCEDIDECFIKKGGCDQRCRNTEGSFYCYCTPGHGLAIEDKTKCNVCGGNLDSLLGEFSSPGYPSLLQPLQNCQWVIKVQENHYLRVEISNLSIPVSKRCVDNYFKLQHGKFNYKRRLCGKFSHISYIVKEASSSFRFRTGRSNFSSYTGFTLTYKQIPIAELSLQELNTVYVNDIAIPYETNNWLS